mmetsp:Transcript_16564/g.40507  ORF Transcript_16564/g.40507 Transcript_16564/m.40507 type:complete len:2315 (+) Transcript_16564:297-7241(+)
MRMMKKLRKKQEPDPEVEQQMSVDQQGNDQATHSQDNNNNGGDDDVEMNDANHDAASVDLDDHTTLDCYPYTFTPLLLFCQSSYFDKGYSNYNSVAQFFASVLPVNMLENVLYDRKNMLYEELLDHVSAHEMLVTCCIDAHFTAFQVIQEKKGKPAMLYYDPLKASLTRVSGEGFKMLCLYLLMKCNYGDSQHIQENKDHYTGIGASHTRRMIYHLWRKINQISSPNYLSGVKFLKAPLNLKDHFLINDAGNCRYMSTQLTSNTCYFQTFLFAVLCKVCKPSMNGYDTVDLENVALLEHTTIQMCKYLLEFFVQPNAANQMTIEEATILRPLTNSNLPLDFYRFQSSPYYQLIVKYLGSKLQDKSQIPVYELQYNSVMEYYWETKILHTYSRFVLEGAMTSSPNTKSLQSVNGVDDAVRKLARADYYKYRAANFMFGFNAGILQGMESFCEFNSWRKNQLLRYYPQLSKLIGECSQALLVQGSKKITKSSKDQNKYRDYYFMPQFEIGQKELVDVHHYTYLIDLFTLVDIDSSLKQKIQAINSFLADHIYFSTQKTANYEKLISTDDFRRSKKFFKFFSSNFMSCEFMSDFIGLGFAEINPKEKEINSLTQTVFYTADLARTQANRQSFEFEKECINQMARSNYRRYIRRVDTGCSINQKYKVNLKIGMGFTYSKYNTLFHFLNVAQEYWNNPDLSNIQVFGKDTRVLLAVSCQKIFFQKGHCGSYHYGILESNSSYGQSNDLAVSMNTGDLLPTISKEKRSNVNQLVLTDRIFEYNYLKEIVEGLFARANGVRLKSDNEVVNLCLLSLMLDFGIYDKYVKLLNLPLLQSLQHSSADTKELQVEVANLIYEFDKKNTNDHVTRSRVEELIFEISYKFLVNKNFSVQSRQFKLIRLLNSDPDYQSYVLLVKIYVSLCQINRSTEVDYYKVHCDGEFRIIIPQNFSKETSDYLDQVTQHYTFSEKDEHMMYDDLPVFDLRPQQPEINLFRVRFDSSTELQSMVKYLEMSNVFQVIGEKEKFLMFVADNVLLVEHSDGMTISINKIRVEVATVFFNEAISFIPCFKYAESEDVVIFTSSNIHYNVSQAGQFCTDYYGMKHDLIECIASEEIYVDLNDEHVFKSFKLTELLTESKTVIYFPDYLLQVTDRQHLINLLDVAVKIRNISFFILVLFYLRRSSVLLEYIEKEGDVVKIAGPWKEAILYVLNRAESNTHYDDIFKRQFFDLNQYQNATLDDFIDHLCENFTKYQRFIDGEYQIVPRPKQKAFLKKIIKAEKPLTFSEVGSGKTKVILPLLCQTFLSNNLEAHKYFARGGKNKHILVILVPEHLVSDARTQVYRYCLNLNFRQNYRVYDDIFALMHRNVKVDGSMKQIFVASFNSFKKALTYDAICQKVWSVREHILVVADEVDDFLDRNKLVFNICSNKNNTFDRPTLDLFYEISKAAYRKSSLPNLSNSSNPDYWGHLHRKFGAIHTEIQDASRSINKSFGIFNEYTLRHCATNIVHDIEGYKGLIARPYESVNRAMPGSYYSDVERTIFLTYVILTEDITKYDELFQGERKFISFEYWNAHFVHQLDFDDLVYGHEKLSEIVEKHPETKDGLTRYLYEIILRRMEIRDRSRSVNSIDIIFNFDCIGFTGTPFLDNYPTFDYIRTGRQDDIPDLIDRSFYAYTSDGLTVDEFEERFALFQGQNSNVLVEYKSSDFIRESTSEMEMLASIFSREEASGGVPANALVDLCGIFKRSTIHDVRNLILKNFGPDRFKYIYHIDPADNRDRVLYIQSENDAQYDEEFYNHMCNTYDADLRDKIFFFVDNRNVIGKDIPFQLVYQRHYGQPLFTKSVVIAHDVDDFSKIWQAMGRSRTMNDTIFSIYKSGVPKEMVQQAGTVHDIKKQELTRHLYVHNCDCKIAGNISSIYLTLIALYNLSNKTFYYRDEIVNVFLEKMESTIGKNLSNHEQKLLNKVLGNSLPRQIFLHILVDKFKRSANKVVSGERLSENRVTELLRHIVQQKFEQRAPSGDILDDYIIFLSGEQHSLMEISYTKQQQKQKQKQQNKNQDSDAMGVFDKRNQLHLQWPVDNYFDYTRSAQDDKAKVLLNLPSTVPIATIAYELAGQEHTIRIYPTLQFLYSHFIAGAYITPTVQESFKKFDGDESKYYSRFWSTVNADASDDWNPQEGKTLEPRIITKENYIRQSPQYTIAGLRKGVYVIGMKEQFNSFDVLNHPLKESIKYVADDMGFVLFDRTTEKNVDTFGPYFLEHYILMEVLSKHEVSQNVIDYYCNHKDLLQKALDSYDERQGKGFICWRFLINETAKAAAVQNETMER